MILYLDCVPIKQNPETSVPECADTPEEFLIVLRQHRNVILSQTDWRIMIDSPLSETEKTEWINYRSYLRNLTEYITLPLSNTVEINDPPNSGGPIRVMGRTPD
jgi:hypothetical protein